MSLEGERKEGARGRGEFRASIRRNNLLTMVLCRTFALAFFAAGVTYWAAIIGIDPQWRFDTMPIWWKTAALAFAVLYPVAGTGLWLMAGWGPAVWALIVVAEGIFRIGFAELFGMGIGWLAVLLWGLVMLLILGWIGRRERYTTTTAS